MTTKRRSPVFMLVAFWIVVGKFVFSTGLEIARRYREGVAYEKTVVSLLAIALAIWIAYSCLRGQRVPALITIFLGTMVLSVSAIWPFMSDVKYLGLTFSVPQAVLGSISGFALLTLGIGGVRIGKAEESEDNNG